MLITKKDLEVLLDWPIDREEGFEGVPIQHDEVIDAMKRAYNLAVEHATEIMAERPHWHCSDKIDAVKWLKIE